MPMRHRNGGYAALSAVEAVFCVRVLAWLVFVGVAAAEPLVSVCAA
jgi:hypothetical protein